MTKQKKFKKRVRARMSEDGTRYTEARSVEETGGSPLEQTVLDLISLRDRRDLSGILARLAAFHDHHVPRRSFLSSLQALVLEVLWPAQVPTLHLDPETGREMPSVTAVALRHLLSAWVEGRPLEGVAAVAPPSEAHTRAARNHLEAIWPAQVVGYIPPGGSPEKEDEEFYTVGLDGPRPVSDEEEATLAELWPCAPDVREYFGEVLESPMAVRRHEAVVTALTDLPRLVVREAAETAELKAAADVHEMAAEFAAEIRRLREIMLAHGINPDV